MNNGAVHLKLAIVAAIWGFGWPAGRVVAAEVEPITGALLRYIIVVAMFLAYLKSSDQWLLPSKSQWKVIVAIGFFSTFCYQALFMYGMKHTAAGDASLMITFNPLFTAVLAVFFLKEAMHRRLFFGLLLAFSGVAVLFLASPNTDIPTTDRWLGNVFIAAAAHAWATSSSYPGPVWKCWTTAGQPLPSTHGWALCSWPCSPPLWPTCGLPTASIVLAPGKRPSTFTSFRRLVSSAGGPCSMNGLAHR